jgi:hypothetical protein
MRSFLNRAWCFLKDWAVWILKGLFYDSKATLSLGRVAIVLGLSNVWVLVWLAVVWIGYVTVTRLLAAAAPLATAVATAMSTILSGQLLIAGLQYWTQHRYGGGGATAEQIQQPTPAGPCPAEDGQSPGGI